MAWLDRQGELERLPVAPGHYSNPRVSPDGNRIAVGENSREADIWIWDLVRATFTRLTVDPGLDRYPAWAPNGQSVAFTSNRAGSDNLYLKAADGTGTVEQLTRDAQFGSLQFSFAFLPDSSGLLFGRDDIAIVSMEDNSIEWVLSTDFNEREAALSSDGQWLAYQSSESGHREVYVRPFPRVDEARWPVSSGGGVDPVWSPDGRELFYLAPEGQIMSVSADTTTSFLAGSASPVFDANVRVPFRPASLEGRHYDISPDGERFLVLEELEPAEEAEASTTLHVVVNWFTELERLAPTP